VHVDPMASAVKEKVKPAVHKPFTVQSICKTEFLKDVDTSLLKDPCANPGKHVLRSVALENQVVDSRAIEQCAQDQSGRTRANDRNLNVERGAPHASRCVKRSGALGEPLDGAMLDIKEHRFIRTLQDDVEAVAWRLCKSRFRPTKVSRGLRLVHRRDRLGLHLLRCDKASNERGASHCKFNGAQDRILAMMPGVLWKIHPGMQTEVDASRHDPQCQMRRHRSTARSRNRTWLDGEEPVHCVRRVYGASAPPSEAGVSSIPETPLMVSLPELNDRIKDWTRSRVDHTTLNDDRRRLCAKPTGFIRCWRDPRKKVGPADCAGAVQARTLWDQPDMNIRARGL